ncbi:MAG TPA: hypothetical protein VEH06_04945 [Candidatus Bathyarchaeia archaeon]|nr:hypothetical protein [Candidatus Bathyarchaeia archaeon]
MSTTGGDNRTGALSVKKEFPDPRTLPAQPSWQQPRPQLTLSDLIPGQYVSTTARIAYVKTSERTDALGTKLVFTGVLEDSTFKAPFVSHRISYPLIRNSVYKFNSAYVHEFEDKSLLLVVTEHTKIEPKNIEDYREFVWTPKIESIKRPVHYVALQGVITTIHGNSGLIKRCNKCKSILHDSCPNNCNNGWGWDLRVSSRLYDGSGSTKMILTKDIASTVLQKSLSELIMLASQPIPSNNNQFQTSICNIKIPETIEVVEAVSEYISSYRKSDKFIVTDGRNLAYLPANEEHHFTDFSTRKLRTSESEDMKIIRRLIDKALELSIKKVTGHRKMHGIFLLEEPIPLYRCEKARLYLGFSTRVSVQDSRATIEWTPQAYVRESVLDYVQLRRERGASATAIERIPTSYRNRVIVAPTGNYGSIVEVIMRKAGNHRVSDTDARNLVEFWKQIYDIDISPDEIPLLKVKMVNSEVAFTYPPSMCFFAGGDSLVIPAGVQKFIESKKSTLKTRIDEVARSAIRDFKIGDLNLDIDAAITEQKADLQTQLLQETRQRLFGRNVSAWGSVLSVHDELWFFPNQIRFW